MLGLVFLVIIFFLPKVDLLKGFEPLSHWITDSRDEADTVN